MYRSGNDAATGLRLASGLGAGGGGGSGVGSGTVLTLGAGGLAIRGSGLGAGGGASLSTTVRCLGMAALIAKDVTPAVSTQIPVATNRSSGFI